MIKNSFQITDRYHYYHLYLKIFESVIYQQLMKYLLENKLLSSQQYGFRANHSTELAALNLIDRLTYDLDNGKIPVNIYIYRSSKGIRHIAT